jgi:hypothetical protein
MTARIVRQLYIYIAAFIGLQMLAAGSRDLLTLLGERLIGGSSLSTPEIAALRLGGSVALLVVGALLWAAHWALARRDARQPDGQGSALRRLYAYAVLLVAALGALFALQEALTMALSSLGQSRVSLQFLSPLISAAVSGAVWLAHWRLFSADRAQVEAAGPNATLRRWYLALTLWVGLAMTSFGAGVLVHSLLQRFIFAAPGAKALGWRGRLRGPCGASAAQAHRFISPLRRAHRRQHEHQRTAPIFGPAAQECP